MSTPTEGGLGRPLSLAASHPRHGRRRTVAERLVEIPLEHLDPGILLIRARQRRFAAAAARRAAQLVADLAPVSPTVYPAPGEHLSGVHC